MMGLGNSILNRPAVQGSQTAADQGAKPLFHCRVMESTGGRVVSPGLQKLLEHRHKVKAILTRSSI